MSLVHESLVEVLNRRFVSTYFNTFDGPGASPEAAAWLRQASGGRPVRYGAICTPDGELLVSFGYDRAEFARSIREALAARPELARPTPEEEAVLAAAAADPTDARASLAAAELYAGLLDFTAARAAADRAVATANTLGTKARALYLRGHLSLIDLDAPDPAAMRADFDAMPVTPDDIEDDVALDRLAARVELRPRQGFFPGWMFEEGVDLQAVETDLMQWIEHAPESDRIGQMHFFLGLARIGRGDADGADAAWDTHVTTWPEDRWALLSRVHHTDYEFSPFNRNGTRVLSGEDLDPETLQELLREAMRGGGPGQGVQIDGSSELGRKLIERMLEQQRGGEEPAPEQGDTPPTDETDSPDTTDSPEEVDD